MQVTNMPNDQATASSLLEDLKSTDSKVKINALRGLGIIAFALGRERTRNELLPFLADCIDEEEDETLIELARALSTFLDCIGGKAYASKLFKILETLLSIDEVTVKNEAVISMKIILSQVNPSDFENEIMEIINRLASSDFVNHKQSAVNLIEIIYKFLSATNKASAITHLMKFTKDESPMLKKEISSSLKGISNFIDVDLFANFISLFLKDSNDSVRIQIMDAIVSVKTHPDCLDFQDYIASILPLLSNDESWRVRLTVGDKVSEILNFPLLSSKLQIAVVDAFAKLLEDTEAETRNACCLKLETFAERLGKDDLIDKILIPLRKLEKDTTSFVRGALASTLLRLCPLIGKDRTNEYIFPIFLNMIKDENHDIRMTLIKTLDRLHEVINIDIFVQSIIPSLLELSANKSWRIRIQVSESIPVLSRILNKNLFMENILSICITWLTDPVFAIRESACKLMKKLYDIFKGDEFEKKLLEKLNEMRVNQSYLVRNTVVFMAKEFVYDEFDYDFLERKISPLIFKLSKDKISNVRMNSAGLLKKMLKFSKSKDVLKESQGCIEELKRDTDIDVVNALNDN